MSSAGSGTRGAERLPTEHTEYTEARDHLPPKAAAWREHLARVDGKADRLSRGQDAPATLEVGHGVPTGIYGSRRTRRLRK